MEIFQSFVSDDDARILVEWIPFFIVIILIALVALGVIVGEWNRCGMPIQQLMGWCMPTMR